MKKEINFLSYIYPGDVLEFFQSKKAQCKLNPIDSNVRSTVFFNLKKQEYYSLLYYTLEKFSYNEAMFVVHGRHVFSSSDRPEIIRIYAKLHKEESSSKDCNVYVITKLENIHTGGCVKLKNHYKHLGHYFFYKMEGTEK